MPSAANIKVDKQITSETASVDSASNQQNTPIRQAIVVIEHKIRNLEKRKSKLESYRELQSSGKDLNQDQKVAVAKYDEVVQTLEFARDLCKQFQGIAVVADKDAKKVARKEAAAKSQQELAKVREVLLVQDALTQLGQDTVREDFLLGRNGAARLNEEDLKLLDDLYPEVSPKHEPGSPTDFTTQVQNAAEHLLAVVDGKPKEVFGSTYSHIKEIIGKIHESGYLDQTLAENVSQEYVEEVIEPVVEVEDIPEVVSEIPMESPMAVYQMETPVVQEEVTVVAPPPPVIEQQQFFQQPRPITEVLGTGAFFFLQDSELDSPEQSHVTEPQNPAGVISNAAIPSQTFTNQNFAPVAEAVVPRQNPIAGFVANPPPPIPMPPSHLTALEYGAMQANPMAYAAYQQSPVPEEQQQQQQQQQPISDAGLRNGAEDIVKPAVSVEDAIGGSPRNVPRPRNGNQQRERRNGPPANHGGSGYNQQSYYQHNNGYANSNRQQRPRGGPRSGGNRPQQNAQNKPKQAQH